jgi:hypothetical protein
MRPDSLAKAIGRTHFRYSQYLNRRHRRSGHLWQNRFFSCALDEVHLWRTLGYVIRHSTHRGRPLASDALLSKLEQRLGRRLRPLPVGRPRKRRPILEEAGLKQEQK